MFSTPMAATMCPVLPFSPARGPAGNIPIWLGDPIRHLLEGDLKELYGSGGGGCPCNEGDCTDNMAACQGGIPTGKTIGPSPCGSGMPTQGFVCTAELWPP
jgi:hypothetical protein